MPKPLSTHFCTKYTIDKMRMSGRTPTLTELQQAILSEAKYHNNWPAAVTLFEDFDRIVWERLTRLLDKNNDKTTGQSNNKQTLKEIWSQTPIALQPLSFTELKYVRQVYQIMVRRAPSIKDIGYYYLNLLKKHIDTPILDDEVINHCLNSLIYQISLSKDSDYLTIGLDLVEIALKRNMGIHKDSVLHSVSKGILEFNGVRISESGKILEKERSNDKKIDRANSKKKSNKKYRKNGSIDNGRSGSSAVNNNNNNNNNNNDNNTHGHNIRDIGRGDSDKVGKNGVILSKKAKSSNVGKDKMSSKKKQLNDNDAQQEIKSKSNKSYYVHRSEEHCWPTTDPDDEINSENDEWNKKEYPPNCQQIQQEQNNSEVIGSLFIRKYNSKNPYYESSSSSLSSSSSDEEKEDDEEEDEDYEDNDSNFYIVLI